MEQFSLWGTIVNALAVVVGSGSVLLVKAIFGKAIAKRTPGGSGCAIVDKIRSLADPVMKALGLCVLVIGINGTLKGENTLVMIISLVIGTVIGTLLDLDAGINKLGKWIEDRTKGRFGSVAEGFVSASLLFCVGAMTVLGSLDSGLRLDHSTLYTKSILDLCASAIFASTMGIGVMFSSVFVFVYQGAITLFAGSLAPFLSEVVVNEMTAVGSVLIIGLALNVLGLTKLKTMNALPAVFIPIILCTFM